MSDTVSYLPVILFSVLSESSQVDFAFLVKVLALIIGIGITAVSWFMIMKILKNHT